MSIENDFKKQAEKLKEQADLLDIAEDAIIVACIYRQLSNGLPNRFINNTGFSMSLKKIYSLNQ